MQVNEKKKRWAIVSVGVLIGTLIAVMLRSSGVETEPRAKINEIVDRHLTWADQESRQAVWNEVHPVQQFFNEARQRTRRFAEDVLSFESKWKLATDYVTGGHEHS